ncbi:MAG: tRNA (adenosine(37)-N6)-threonylcarbamoyltransferase complex transferase subunit TsaD [Spirochaetes bacterium]|jgi:N6-L-threonylcarbamoyladenine synthase|nr:tRNA (adenosine(37)-N6)-threonylcarbamoyltransferase complex transferase subunit TsaD [Spirochaetota bacterium]
MTILGVETSCDECSIALVEDGRRLIAQQIASQIEFHAPYSGVVPEIASRKHTEWILDVYHRTLEDAAATPADIDGVAVTTRPGLSGSLVVGLSFAKALAFGLGVPIVGVNHILAHLYAPHLEYEIDYPYLGLLVSGGHTLITMVRGVEDIEVLGTTVDDACGEAFDKVAKFLELGYPGGVVIDRLAREGSAEAFSFPLSTVNTGADRYDVSYSGLKTAVVNQMEKFRTPGYDATNENIAASFQRAAIETVVVQLERAVADSGITTVVVGGGVAANSYLRERLSGRNDLRAIFPSMELCTDNGAMIAGIGYHLLRTGGGDDLSLGVSARVSGYRHPRGGRPPRRAGAR